MLKLSGNYDEDRKMVIRMITDCTSKRKVSNLELRGETEKSASARDPQWEKLHDELGQFECDTIQTHRKLADKYKEEVNDNVFLQSEADLSNELLPPPPTDETTWDTVKPKRPKDKTTSKNFRPPYFMSNHDITWEQNEENACQVYNNSVEKIATAMRGRDFKRIFESLIRINRSVYAPPRGLEPSYQPWKEALIALKTERIKTLNLIKNNNAPRGSTRIYTNRYYDEPERETAVIKAEIKSKT